jgi:ATP synthase protein I
MLRHLNKPIRAVFRWQLGVTVAMCLAAAVVAGADAALSAAAGGLISMVAGAASAFAASMSTKKSAGGLVLGALRAEAVKLGLAIILLWTVLVNYDGVVAAALIGTFIVTIVIFAMAFFVREY